MTIPVFYVQMDMKKQAFTFFRVSLQPILLAFHKCALGSISIAPGHGDLGKKRLQQSYLHGNIYHSLLDNLESQEWNHL